MTSREKLSQLKEELGVAYHEFELNNEEGRDYFLRRRMILNRIAHIQQDILNLEPMFKPIDSFPTDEEIVGRERRDGLLKIKLNPRLSSRRKRWSRKGLLSKFK